MSASRQATRAQGRSSTFPHKPVETLSGNRTLTASELDRYQFFSFDSGGAARNITLPSLGSLKGKPIFIANVSNDTEPQTILDSSAATVAVVDQGQSIMLWSDGTNVLSGVLPGGAGSGNIVKFTETFAFDDMTDGGSTAGTYAITTGNFPVGSYALCVLATAVTGFAGDSSAVIIIGDGSDDDRYMTGTPSVFATAANGVALGDPSGVRYHATAATPTVTITSGTDFGNVSAGSITLEFYFLT